MEKEQLIKHSEKLYKSVNTLIITCVGTDGYPMTKAVMPGKHRDSLNEIYICTNTSSKFANAVINNSKASVYFYSRKLVWEGCLLKGDMEIVTDMDVKARFWQSKFKNAYPQGTCADPDYCVLKFTPKSGRYYAWFKPQDFEL